MRRSDFRTDQEWQEHLRQVLAEHNGFSSWAEWQLAKKHAADRRARREMVMANKELMTIREQLGEVAKRLKATHEQAIGARDTLRGELAGLTTPRAMRHLSDVGRREARETALKQAQAVRPQIQQALALATSTMQRREAATGKRQVLRRARFIDLPETERDGNAVKPEVHELRLLREELQRARWRADLMDADADELAEEIAEASASQNYAVLNLASRVVRARAKADPASMQAARIALINAEQAIELPEDVQATDALFAEIDSLAWRLSDTLHELETGNEPQAPRAAIERIDELARAHGPLEGPMRAAEERLAVKKAVKDQADNRATKIIERAIRADEADTATLN